MTDKHKQEQEFAEFMSGKTALSEAYQRVEHSTPSEFTDQRILSAARTAVAAADKPARSTLRWIYPIAIAAGLAVFVIVLVLQYQPETVTPADIASQDSVDREKSSNLRHDPTRLLMDIVELYNAGKINEAREQLAVFRQLFPNQEIDYHKFPELKKLENP